MYKKSFNTAELQKFNQLKSGKNLTDDQLLKLARKAKGAKATPKVTSVIDNTPKSTSTIKSTTTKIKSQAKKVKESWDKIKVRWNGLSKAQRRFYRVAGLVLGVSLLAWLYYVLSKENYCKCLLNMMTESDAEYMDSVSMEDGMFLGTTNDPTLDSQGGCIFYEDGKFKTKNGKIEGTYTCNSQGVFMTSGGNEYVLKCLGGENDLLPIPEDGGEGGKVEDKKDIIVYKDCEGPEYQLGCTDKGDLIERVQACLRLPVTGKFDKELEVALLKKIGKRTFNEEDVFIICGVQTSTKFTFGKL